MKHILRKKLFLIVILLLASFFRLYGLDWDQGQHLHPDERFLTMVATAIKIPRSFLTYLNPQTSPMSPYNNNYSFFVYGTFPLYLTKIVGVLTGNNDYGNIHLVGRFLSALFDIGTVYFIYLISKKILSQKSSITNYQLLITPLLAAFLYSIMVLPIQLSHFFAVDTFLNFFLVLSFYFLVILIQRSLITNYYLLITSSALGGAFGLALACKISALYFLPIIGLGYFYLFTPAKNKKFVFVSFLFFVFCFLFFFRLAQPTAFSSGNFLKWHLGPQFIANLKEQNNLSGPDSWFPPAVQWHSTKPIFFPLKNMVLWGMGLPLGMISIISVGYSIVILLSCYLAKKKNLNTLITNYQLLITTLVVIWVLGLFIYQGLQFGKTMRYFLPIYPFLVILSAIFLVKVGQFFKKIIPRVPFLIANCLLLIAILVYPISFMSIYSRPISRVSASEWIYENIPAGSTVTYEEWDDGLPLGLPNYSPVNFKVESLFMYDFDTPEKWQRINKSLEKVDYVFLTSNRAYGSTMKLPDKYPQTTAYYQSLFGETGNFKKAAEFTSYPCFPPFGNKHLFCFNDDSAEEAFTVYDHPKVIIFKKYSR